MARKNVQRSKYLRGIYKLETEKSRTDAVIESLKEFSNVLAVEKLPEEELLLVPSDPNHSLQNYLALIRAYDAWDITQGSPDIVVAVSDNGTDLDHEDLQENLFLNVDDPINGIDDDGNGYIDDYNGYDLADNDHQPTADIDNHGTLVAGVIGASASNETGITGVGYNTSYFPLKVFRSQGGGSRNNYESIIYAADMGFDVINLSWGSVNSYSSILQDIINYAVLENDMIVIAAGGNTNAELEFYPASYDHVLSVGATDIEDIKAGWGTYSFQMDLVTAGVGVYSTQRNNGYGGDHGTSFAAPQVAAVAALVRSEFPELDARQVMERIRMTTDDIYHVEGNADYYGMLGKGRLNMLRAVSEQNVASMRSYDMSYQGPFGQEVYFGDTVSVDLDFVNILRPLKGAELNISTSSPFATIINPNLLLGAVPTYDSLNAPSIKILLHQDAPANERMIFRVESSDLQGYDDFQYFEFNTAPSQLEMDNGQLALTVSSNGGLGYETDIDFDEHGLHWQGTKVCDIVGVMIGNSQSSISDNLPNNYFNFSRESDFDEATTIRPFQRSNDLYVRNRFEESSGTYLIEQEFLASTHVDSSDFLIVEYYVTNTSQSMIEDLKLALYADFDLAVNHSNFTAWNADERLGYTFTTGANEPLAGIALLSDQEAGFFGVELFDQGGSPIDLDDGAIFTDSAKYHMMNQLNESAGGESGFNVAQLLSAGIGTLEAASSSKVAFAIIFGRSEGELVENLIKARAKYQDLIDRPGLAWTISSCREEAINFENELQFTLYSDPYGANVIGSGHQLQIEGFSDDSVFYFQTHNEGSSSDIYRLDVSIANPNIEFRADPQVLYLGDDPSNRVQFIDLSLGAAIWNWDFGNGSFSTVKNPKVVYNEPGVYDVSLSIVTAQGCEDEAFQTYQVVERGEAPIIENQIICQGETAVLSATNSNSLRVYQTASGGQPIFEGEQFVTDELMASTIYYVASTAEEVESNRVPVEVLIDPIQSIFQVALDTLDFSSSQFLSITDMSINASGIAWQVNEIDQGNDIGFTFDYTGLSTVNVSQTVSSDLGCESNSSQNISPAASLKPGVTEQTVCRWDSAFVQPINGEIFVYYADEAMTQIIAKGSTARLGPVISDTSFYVTNITNYLESEPSELQVGIYNFDPQIDADPDSLKLVGVPIATFFADNSEIESYRWFIEGEFVEAASSPSLVFDSVGIYDVELVSRNALGCVDTSGINYKVYNLLNANNYYNELSIYPNPFSEFLIVDIAEGAKLENLKLMNMLGQEMPVDIIDLAGHMTISTKKIPSGLYLLTGYLSGDYIRFSVIRH